MILYHISVDLRHNGNFEPRIPPKATEKEDVTIPRICVSTSIEGCLSAMPDGGASLGVFNRNFHGIYKLFRIDTYALDLVDHTISSQELVEKGYVVDAVITEEYWITKGFTVTESAISYISVTYFDREIQEGYYRIIDLEYTDLKQTDSLTMWVDQKQLKALKPYAGMQGVAIIIIDDDDDFDDRYQIELSGEVDWITFFKEGVKAQIFRTIQFD